MLNGGEILVGRRRLGEDGVGEGVGFRHIGIDGVGSGRREGEEVGCDEDDADAEEVHGYSRGSMSSSMPETDVNAKHHAHQDGCIRVDASTNAA